MPGQLSAGWGARAVFVGYGNGNKGGEEHAGDVRVAWRRGVELFYFLHKCFSTRLGLHLPMVDFETTLQPPASVAG